MTSPFITRMMDKISSKKEREVYDDAYWKRRHEESLEGKYIVTRYLIAFGFGCYNDFCGIKEIKGFYDKTYNYNVPIDDPINQEKTVDIFSQIDLDDSYSLYNHPVDRVFKTFEEAQDYYNKHVEEYTTPLLNRVKALMQAKKSIVLVSPPFEVMKTYVVNGEKRRVLCLCGKEVTYDDGNYSGIPRTISTYRFASWLLTNALKI